MKDLIQYYIVDHSLKMRKGKIAAQVAHGAMYAMNYYFECQDESYLNIFESWLNADIKKCILKGAAEDLNKAEEEFGKRCSVVKDNGHTQVPVGSRTVVVLPVMDKSEAPEWIKNLQLL